jgi:hypothetical protein
VGYLRVLARSLYYSFGRISAGFGEYVMRILIGECYTQCIVCSLKRIFKLGSFGLRTPSCGCYMSVDKFPIYCGAEWCGLLVKV